MKVRNLHRKVGRPSVASNEEVVRKLEMAFQNGMSDRTACQFAKIGHTSFYKALKESEQFTERIQSAKNFLKLLAGKRLVQVLKDGEDHDVISLIKFTLEKLEPEKFGKQGSVTLNQNFHYIDPDWFTWPDFVMNNQNIG